uniref:Uncharacterized protein n=1 Tax=Stegastes partitus TaxID=144197 RepID=A0A3B4ZG32_9TELE
MHSNLYVLCSWFCLYYFIMTCWVFSGDGGWGHWSTWTECTKSCGGGMQSRRRECDSPSPEGEGNYCEGLGTESLPGCHVDGGWSQWGTWTECSVPCGGGVKFRRRLCDNPSPQSGGRGCLGVAEQQKNCNLYMCTAGPWLAWSQWSVCSVSCGGGQQSRSRFCSSPPCSGPSRQSKTCNTHVCLGELNYTLNQLYGACSLPHPSVPCSGCEHGRWNCSLEHCPVDGALSPWGPWSPCSLSCGGLGLKTRSRGCTNPAPVHGGRDCQGPRQETTYCQAPDCPGTGLNLHRGGAMCSGCA